QRLQPGKIADGTKITTIAAEAKDRGVPIRIGVNAGSLDKKLYEKHGGATPEALVESAQIELAYFEEVGFDDVKISVKASYVPLMVQADRMRADPTDPPAALGGSEAGTAHAAQIES